MAPRIIPEHGFDPSCGTFGVAIKQSNSGDGASIKVQFDEWIGLDQAVYCAEIPWSGDEISVADAEKLLDSANVPSFIQDVSAIGMILQCVNQTLEEIIEVSGPLRSGLPSIVAMISSDKEADEWDEYYFEDNNEE